eukprot:a3619_4.p2 GENE.a3619_4~~a3619_4.p2  ORF type:complete len:157 (+),score=54.12 a3619_4:31-471(+)
MANFEDKLDEDIARLEEMYATQSADMGGRIEVHLVLNLAHRLIASRDTEDCIRGVDMLERSDHATQSSVSCLYLLALGSYRLQRLSNARAYTENLLAQEPNHTDAIVLRRLIDESTQREGFTGAIMVGSISAILATFAFLYTRARK